MTKNPDKEFDERLLDRDVLIDTIGDKTLEKLIKPHMGGYAYVVPYVQKDWIVVSIKKLGIMDPFILPAVVKVIQTHIRTLETWITRHMWVVPVCGKMFVKKDNGEKIMQRLITFGCSYTYGTGLEDCKNWFLNQASSS